MLQPIPLSFFLYSLLVGKTTLLFTFLIRSRFQRYRCKSLKGGSLEITLAVPFSLPPTAVVTVTPETMLPSLEPLAEADSRSNPSLRSTGGPGLTISLEDPTCKIN